MKLRLKVLRAFLERVLITSHKACWVWQGRRDLHGYGIYSIRVGKQKIKNWRAHRLMWVINRGKIPKGLIINHLCSNRSCVNPLHLEVCTHSENAIHREKVKRER